MAVTIHSVRSKTQPEDTHFEALFQEYWKQVYDLLFRLVGDPDEAQDLALETFYRLHRRPPQLDDPRKLGGWLYRVSLRLGYNALRAFQRRSRYEQEAGRLYLEGSKAPDPAQEVELAEQRIEVRRVLAAMKPRSARVLVLRHSGLPYAEIATTLGVSVASVGTLLARAEQEFERLYRSREE